MRPRPAPRAAPGGHPTRAAVVCALLAVVLWLTLTLRQTRVAELDVPTDVVSLPPGRALAAPVPATVRVQVEGEGYRLLPLFSDRPRVPIAATADEVVLGDALPRLPAGVRLAGVEPAVLRLRTGPLVTRRVPVRFDALVAFAPTYDLADTLRLTPDSVSVTGAEEVVEGIRAWPTAQVRLRRVREDLSVLVPLADTLAGLVRRSPDAVRATAPVAAFTGAEREVEVRVVGAPAGARPLTPDPPTVRVRYRVELGAYEASLRRADFYATVPYAALTAGGPGVSGRARPALHLPTGLRLRDVDVAPATVGYYTRIEPR